MKTNRILQYLAMLTCAVMFAFVTGCEGPEGPVGPKGDPGDDGTNGTNGADANETCKLCHNPESVDLISTQFQLSKHEYGEAAFEEAGNTTCTPCHAQEAFKDVVARNVPATFTLNTTTNKYVNDYATLPSTAYGEIGCSTCHSAIHDTYTASDLPSLTTVAPVSMSMWAGAKTIDLQADGGTSNLCVKCHQPRPLTKTSNSNVLDYDTLRLKPTKAFTQITNLSYRTHVHYGAVGAIVAGKGGVEFAGTMGYGNSPHTANASCQDCHMADGVYLRTGGHTFKMRSGEAAPSSSTQWNFAGCNTTDCHNGSMSKTSSDWTNTRSTIKAKLDLLASELVVDGKELMNRNPDAEHNLWVGLTTNNYDGYMNVYDPVNNPDCVANNGGTGKQFKNMSTSGFTADQITYNNTLTPLNNISNAQMGAIINFQLCLREYSLGIHNGDYSMALLQNSIEAVQ